MDFPDAVAQTKSTSQPKPRRRAYKCRAVNAGGFGTVLLGQSSVKPEKIESTLNELSAQGWRHSFSTVSHARMLLLWRREVVTLYFDR